MILKAFLPFLPLLQFLEYTALFEAFFVIALRLRNLALLAHTRKIPLSQSKTAKRELPRERTIGQTIFLG